MFSSSKSPKSSFLSKHGNTLVVIIAVLFFVVTLDQSADLAGNVLAMVGLPTEVKQVHDNEGNTCRHVPMLLTVTGGIVLGLLTVATLNWWVKSK